MYCHDKDVLLIKENDEFDNSLNTGNFDAILGLLKRVNVEYHRVLNNAHSKHTSLTI